MTEVAVIVTDGVEILDQWESLIKPDESIPDYITALTGIDDSMVYNAPEFSAIQQQLFDITEGCIFVAHSVNFDYGFIRRSFKDLDVHFYRKKLCTVRMTKALMPGLPSYSLSRLSHQFNLSHPVKHRAMGDVIATFHLLQMLIAEFGTEYITHAIKKQSAESSLPPYLNHQVFYELPEETGVYHFHDASGKIIYTGKAKNIKQRITGHFNSKAPKQQLIRREVHDISYELTGSDMIAELLESELIKSELPPLNSAQRRASNTCALFCYEDQKGFLRMVWGKGNLPFKALKWFNYQYEAREFLNELCEEFRLCPRYCGLQKSSGACYAYEEGQCKGACCNKEKMTSYNKRVQKAIKFIEEEKESYLLIDKGRSYDERSIVLVDNGRYCGFGFVHESLQLRSKEDIENFIEPRKDNTDIQRILRMYMKKSSVKLKML